MFSPFRSLRGESSSSSNPPNPVIEAAVKASMTRLRAKNVEGRLEEVEDLIRKVEQRLLQESHSESERRRKEDEGLLYVWSQDLVKLVAPEEDLGRYLMDEGLLEKILRVIMDLTREIIMDGKQMIMLNARGIPCIQEFFTVEAIAKRLRLPSAPTATHRRSTRGNVHGLRQNSTQELLTEVLRYTFKERHKALEDQLDTIRSEAVSTEPEWKQGQDAALFVIWRNELWTLLESHGDEERHVMDNKTFEKILYEMAKLYGEAEEHGMFETTQKHKPVPLRKIKPFFAIEAIAKRLNFPLLPRRAYIQSSLSKFSTERYRVSHRVAAIHELETLGPAYSGGLVLA
ncbi:hypothetical protein JCM16303_003284 [Sporobolomyces ruberrimus]